MQDDSGDCGNSTGPVLQNLTAPVLGDLSGDLLDWCPDEFGVNNPVSLGTGLTAAAA